MILAESLQSNLSVCCRQGDEVLITDFIKEGKVVQNSCVTIRMHLKK